MTDSEVSSEAITSNRVSFLCLDSRLADQMPEFPSLWPLWPDIS